MKIDFKISRNTILSSLAMIMATVLIITAGIGLPGILITQMTSKSKLPQGAVDVSGIQPYGTDTLLTKDNLLSAVDSIKNHGLHDRNDLRTVIKSNGFQEIGIQGQLSGRPEFLSAAVNAINPYFPEAIPAQYYARTSISDDGFRFTHVYNDTNDMFFDNQTGIPVVMHISLVSSNDCVSSSLIADIISVYADYIGIEFTSFIDEPASSDGYRDTYYSCRYISSDGDFAVVGTAVSGWYFTPPTSYTDNWHSTDLYVWDFTFIVERT